MNRIFFFFYVHLYRYRRRIWTAWLGVTRDAEAFEKKKKKIRAPRVALDVPQTRLVCVHSYTHTHINIHTYTLSFLVYPKLSPRENRWIEDSCDLRLRSPASKTSRNERMFKQTRTSRLSIVSANPSS